jgi:hypothetical protein
VVSAATAYAIPTKELEQLFLLSDRRHSTIAGWSGNVAQLASCGVKVDDKPNEMAESR